MATKTLVIDGTDREHFFLSVESGTLRVGDAAAHPEGVVRDMRILRIHCEVEVEDDREAVPIDEPGVLAPSSLTAGAPVKLAHAELSLAGETALDLPAFGGTTEVPTFAAPPAANDDAFQLDLDLSGAASNGGDSSTAMEAPGVIARRFKVIDGGDQGRAFKLPEDGTISLGRHGHADIGLNDFYVSKVHCLVHIDGYKIMVSHVEGQAGTLVDGMKISVSHKLRTGSVLRIGNSHLKLEQGPFAEEPESISPPPPPPPKKVVRAVVVKDPLLDLEGKEFGHFKLSKLLGRGFAGAVFVAEDTKKNQTVAVKVLAGEFPASAEELNRFVSEFKTAQSVRHTNLVALQGAGKVGANCWFARELIEGESAADVIQRTADGKKPSWTRAARVLVHLARALEELHKHKLVHGNIAPNNVLLHKESHAVKLADFRLAEALHGSKLHTSFAEKKRGEEAGYSAPANMPAGISADLYSLGAVAYAMIAGKPPEAEKPPKLSKVYEKVPPEFDKVVMRLLSHKLEHRFALPGEVLAEMKPICDTNDVKVS